MNSYGLSISQGVIGIPLLNLKTDDKDYYVIQAAITIAAGNSGGALIDESANLIGITSFRIKDNEGSPIYGIAYCIPVNDVKVFMEAKY